jgi:hypothetical protein
MGELLPYQLDLSVSVFIDFVESASRRVDYTGDLAHRARHRVIDVRLLDHRDRLSQAHFVHGVDGLAGVLGR